MTQINIKCKTKAHWMFVGLNLLNEMLPCQSEMTSMEIGTSNINFFLKNGNVTQILYRDRSLLPLS